MANRNRDAGHKFERDIVQLFNRRTINNPDISGEELRKIDDSSFHVLPKLACSREVDRASDARKKDITTLTKERENEFPYVLQCKSLTTKAPYPKLLSEVREKNKNGIPVVLHQQTKKSGKVFRVQDEFAIMYLQDFMDLVYKIHDLEFQLKQMEVNG